MAGRLQDKVALVTGAGCIGPGWDSSPPKTPTSHYEYLVCGGACE